MRFINLIVVHCSATRCDRCYTEHDLTTDHLRRGFSGAGYHFYIRKNGDIGVCYEGGLDECGRPTDTRTLFQKHSLRVLVLLLLKDYPGSRLCGHRDLSPDLNHNGEIEPEEWVKQCPCFDAATILTEPPPPNPACL